MVEKEAQKSQASTSSMTTEKKDDSGKVVIEYPPQTQFSSTLESLMRSAKIKNSLERIIS